LIPKNPMDRLTFIGCAIKKLESAHTIEPKTMALIVLALIVFLLTAFMVSILLTTFASVGGEGETPVASFIYSPKDPSADESVTLNASESYDPDGYIVSYQWNFGDGTKVNETDPVTTHTYDKAGVYTVELTVSDNDGLTDTETKLLVVPLDITIDPLTVPLAVFTYEPQHPLVNEIIVFNASESHDLDGYIVSYYWEFGDGTNATGMMVEHSYAEAGNYLVRLTVTDDDGKFCIALKFVNVIVSIQTETSG